MKTTAKERAEWRAIPMDECDQITPFDTLRLLDDADELARLREGLRDLMENRWIAPEINGEKWLCIVSSDVAALLGDE